ncbi:MAG: hypothetical protein K2M19_07505 [Muribaculaceae bacterium]|nr:hypothetical protein [Muribaculaceae bacterium]
MPSDDLRSAPQSPTPAEPRKPARRFSRFIAVPALVAIGILIYLTFFSEKSVSHRLEYQRIIDSLEIALQQERDTLNYYRDLNERLNTDPVLMERVVREQYNMKRENEDVFVFER